MYYSLSFSVSSPYRPYHFICTAIHANTTFYKYTIYSQESFYLTSDMVPREHLSLFPNFLSLSSLKNGSIYQLLGSKLICSSTSHHKPSPQQLTKKITLFFCLVQHCMMMAIIIMIMIMKHESDKR